MATVLCHRSFWIKLLLWVVLLYCFAAIEFGTVFVIASGFYIVYANLGGEGRQEGTSSAYSVFNRDFKALPGTYSASAFENSLGLPKHEDDD